MKYYLCILIDIIEADRTNNVYSNKETKPLDSVIWKWRQKRKTLTADLP